MRSLCILVWTIGLSAYAFAQAPARPDEITFNRDVLPILQRNCQNCHRPGEAAPMSLLDYRSARPWAKAIKAAVLERTMPPWFADSRFGKFSNDRRLSEDDIQKLTTWVDAGAPEGDARDRKAARQFVDGWNIPKPDLILETPNMIDIPATGVVEYQYVVVPLGLKEDKWVQAVELRSLARDQVHHAVVMIRDHDSKWLSDVPVGVPTTLSPIRDQRRVAGAGARGCRGLQVPDSADRTR